MPLIYCEEIFALRVYSPAESLPHTERLPRLMNKNEMKLELPEVPDITDIGKLMDPLADKMTQVALLGTLAIQKIIPVWIIVIVIIKEFLMVSGASFLYGKELVVSSKWYGKLTTVLFYVAIVCSLFTEYWNGTLINKYNLSTIPVFHTYIYYLAVLTTIFSLIMYIKAFYMQGYLKKALEQENNKNS